MVDLLLTEIGRRIDTRGQQVGGTGVQTIGTNDVSGVGHLS